MRRFSVNLKWAAKARMAWELRGNTAFFQRIAQSRRRRNLICSLEDEHDTLLTSFFTDIRAAFLAFYRRLWGSPGSARLDLLGGLSLPRKNSDSADGLLRPFSTQLT